jgi:hypothetical protein
MTWLNYLNSSKLKAATDETAIVKSEIRATNEGLGKISLTIDGKLEQLVAAKERVAHAVGRQEGIDSMAVAPPDPVATATAVTANLAARALIENAKTTAQALKAASSVLMSPIDTEPARQAALVLRDTASMAATRLLADVVQKDPAAVALAAAVASDLLATAAQIAAALKGVAGATAVQAATRRDKHSLPAANTDPPPRAPSTIIPPRRSGRRSMAS